MVRASSIRITACCVTTDILIKLSVSTDIRAHSWITKAHCPIDILVESSVLAWISTLTREHGSFIRPGKISYCRFFPVMARIGLTEVGLFWKIRLS